MTTTLDLNRLDNVTKPSNFTDKFIVSQNGEVKFVDDEDLVYVFSSSNIVTGFCITGVSGNNFTKKDGKVISPEVNGKQYILNINGNNMNYTKTLAENGLVDIVRTKPYEQEVLSSNTGTYLSVSATSDNVNAYKMFDGLDVSYWESLGTFPQTITATLDRAIVVEKFAIKNSSDDQSVMTSFKIYGQDTSDEWHTIVFVDGTSEIVTDKTAGAWNEYISSDMNTYFKAFKLEVLASVNNSTVSVSRFNIIGDYKGALLPDQKFNIFVIGKENLTNPEAKIVSTKNDVPALPEGYSYGVKIGEYYVGMDLVNPIINYYPTEDVVSYFNDMRNPY